MKRLSTILTILACSIFTKQALAADNPGYFELRVYHYTTTAQEATLDSFIQNEFMPLLHEKGIKYVGAFKAIANDTAYDKKMYVFIPYNNLKQWQKVAIPLRKYDAGFSGYVTAAYNKPAFTRLETMFLKAFELMPPIKASALSGNKTDRVYELRSYESANERIFKNKVQMFNQGGEIDLFARLGFNAVFYSEVIFGSRMPNLMYMTSFENMQSRDEHWKAFSADPFWKVLSAKAEYQNNVQRNEITFLHPTSYSEL